MLFARRLFKIQTNPEAKTAYYRNTLKEKKQLLILKNNIFKLTNNSTFSKAIRNVWKITEVKLLDKKTTFKLGIKVSICENQAYI